MKKRIIIPAILSAVLATGLTSCVKDNESDSVKNLRDAKAEELRGSAEKHKADAALVTAQVATQAMITKFHEAQAAKEAALAKKEEYLTAKEQLNLAKDQAKSEHEIAQAKAQAEEARITAERALAKAKAADDELKAEQANALKALAEAEANLLDAQNELFRKKLEKYTFIEKQMNDAAGEVVKLTGHIIKKETEIAGLTQSATTLEAVKARDIKEQQDIIAKNKALLAALDGLKNGSTEEYAAKVKEYEAKEHGAELAYNTASSTNELEDLEKAAEKVSEQAEQLEISRLLQDFQEKVNDGEILYTQFPLAVDVTDVIEVQNLQALTASDVTSKYEGITTSLFKIEVKADKVNTTSILADLQKNIEYLPQLALQYDNAIALYNEQDENKPGTIANFAKKLADAKEALNQAIENNLGEAVINTRRQAVANAAHAYEEAIRDNKLKAKLRAEVTGVVKEFARVKSFFVGSSTNEDRKAFDEVVAKYNEAVQKAADRYFVEQRLKDQKDNFSKIKMVFKSILTGYEKFDDQYKEAYENIEKAEVAIAEYKKIDTIQDKLNMAKEELAKYKRDKAHQEALLAAYKKQLEAIKLSE
ncbi:exported hypothetical protein [Capnocytophaga canis]|uniref:hypothetical protein n=1 Tax=Capnocytophaga canis TaxID=1848903 RepID=UPI0005899F33|nr:hypothetical protein [Capnocytophaga canis]CEN45069.1 exported hypothetical protein [Capnocytophaga canis]